MLTIFMQMQNKILAWLSVVLLIVEVVLVVGSWLYAALNPESGVRSLFSSEGIRWAFGGYIHQMQSPLLVWLILAGMAYGSLRHSRLSQSFFSSRYRQRVALRFSLGTLVLYLSLVAFFAFAPHAILLSVTGYLFPSAFSAALVPLLCFGVILMSVVYGVMSGSFPSVPSVFDALVSGISSIAPFLILYLIASHLIYILSYIQIL